MSDRGTLRERVQRFNDSVGVFSWGGRHAGSHPDACVCNLQPDAYPGTPHKHYSDSAPFGCARCHCSAYRPYWDTQRPARIGSTAPVEALF